MELSSHYRQVLVMKYAEHRAIVQMAVTLGQPKRAVESLLARARLTFKEHLKRRLAAASRRARRHAQPVLGSNGACAGQNARCAGQAGWQPGSTRPSAAIFETLAMPL